MSEDGEESTKVAHIGVPSADLASAEHAYVIVIAGQGVGEMHRVDGARIIGRDQDADVRLIDEAVSRHHAVLEPRDGGVYVRDLASTNGTFVNGNVVSEQVLRDGDKIMVGTTTILKFTHPDHLEEAFQRQMYESALRDGLTGAFNARYFSERLRSECAYSRRHGTHLALMLFDLDRFRLLNERHGTLAGDHVLTTFGATLHEVIRSEDVLARRHGDTFGVLSRGTDLAAGLRFAERIRDAVASHPFSYEGIRIPVTVSAGIACLPAPDLEGAEALVAAAERALGDAKARGRDRVASPPTGESEVAP